MNEAEWPAEDIETLGGCPVCQSQARDVEYSGLQDRIFFAAHGRWTLWRCLNCGLGYLDPTPTVASISRAYSAYYTHDEVLPDHSDAAPRNLVQNLKRYAMNDFLNKEFGYRLRPSLPVGHFAFLRRPLKAREAREMVRHLPPPKPDGKLIDIGCGNGAFALLARDRLGYDAEGSEIDRGATERAMERGLVVHQAPIPGMRLAEASYAQVTMSHVLEHLHDPMTALREVYSILRPGGRLWIQVPNLNGASAKKFGVHSRLLEPPRHLVMFTPASLTVCLEKAGFVKVARLPTHNKARDMFKMSWLISEGIDPYTANPPAIPVDVLAAAAKTQATDAGLSDDAEMITMIGFRPIS